MSWGVQGITVLRIRTSEGPVVVKASETSHHIQREARAHRGYDRLMNIVGSLERAGAHRQRPLVDVEPRIVHSWSPRVVDLLVGIGDRRWKRILFFADNAGSDIVLGVLPLVREFLLEDAEVVLAANRLPALNDMTHRELVSLLPKVAEVDAVVGDALSSGRLSAVTSGSDIPLLDLARVSCELAALVRERPPDLVVFEGMGRALESNLAAVLAADALRIAMVKNRMVAERTGTRHLGPFLRLTPGA